MRFNWKNSCLVSFSKLFFLLALYFVIIYNREIKIYYNPIATFSCNSRNQNGKELLKWKYKDFSSFLFNLCWLSLKENVHVLNCKWTYKNKRSSTRTNYKSSSIYFVESTFFFINFVESTFLCLDMFLELHYFSKSCHSFRVGTWLRVSVWLAIGLLVYVFYGRTHSSLKDAIYVPATQVEEIYQISRSLLA